MDIQPRFSAFIGAARMPLDVLSLRPLFNTIRSWISSICNSISERRFFTQPVKTLKPLIIFILGPPGTGKGTQSALLKAAFPGLTHLSYGDLIRYEDRIPGSWVGSLPRRDGATTPMVPAYGAVRLINRYIDAGVKRGQLMWLVDGFPRRESHVAAWAAQMPPAHCTLYFSCPRDVSIQRVIGRAETSGRPDDAVPRLVQERVDRSIRESDGLLSALPKYGIHPVEIDTMQNMEDVKQIVHTICQEAMNAWKKEQEL